MHSELNELLSLAWRSYNLDRWLTHKQKMTIQHVKGCNGEKHQVFLEQLDSLAHPAWGSREVFLKDMIPGRNLNDKKVSSR